MKRRLLVDREIAGADYAFDGFGEVRLFDGRALTRDDVGQAEILLVRSVTKVDAALLKGSAVRFVGTSTAGTDHIDDDFLRGAGIHLVAAPGCNARAVAEHVICCMVLHAEALGRPFGELKLGIIGFGHVGRALGDLAGRLGLDFVANDPLLEHAPENVAMVPLGEAMQRDVVSLHVPLTTSGISPTCKLIGPGELAALPSQALLINAARGGVVDEAALCSLLDRQSEIRCAIDCWAGEPRPDGTTLAATWLASPHIAGHSLEARTRASVMLQQALAAWLDCPLPPPPEIAPEPAAIRLARPTLGAVLSGIHDLHRHTGHMAGLGRYLEAERGPVFDRLRRDYGLRREFSAHAVAWQDPDPDTVSTLHALGIRIAGI